MVGTGQSDLFSAEPQPDLFGAEEAHAYRPDADKVRARLNKVLVEARLAEALPREPSRLSLYRTIFPQMTLFLPEEEGARFRLAFETEMARLEIS
jgi:hypothetical protein